MNTEEIAERARVFVKAEQEWLRQHRQNWRVMNADQKREANVHYEAAVAAKNLAWLLLNKAVEQEDSK